MMEGSGLEKNPTDRRSGIAGLPQTLVALVREVKYKSQAIVNNVLGQTFVAQDTTFTEL